MDTHEQIVSAYETYLKENSTLAKTYKGLKEFKEWIPGI